MYYRVAIQKNSPSCWQWKSTILGSLDTLFRLLRLYQAIPPDCLRVFSSRSREEMDDLLARENNGLASNSVTAQQFLQARGIITQAVTRGTAESYDTRAIAVSTAPQLNESSAAEPAYTAQAWGLSTLERRRLELEQGAGDDHDVPYTFALPIEMPVVLAWMRLLAKVQRGELEP